jgi:hypothetical protein
MKRITVKAKAVMLSTLAAVVLPALALICLFFQGRGNHERSMAQRPVALAVADQSAAPVSSEAGEHTEATPIQPAPVVAPSAAAGLKTPAVTQPSQLPGSKTALQDPLAREALTLVGIDPYAEQYWFAALNDPSLPKNERQDLVDDLNEEGLADPKHPTIDDLPLLMARLEILQEAMQWLGEDAYDWKEPYEDLANLVDVALGGGTPVQ